MPGRTPRSLLLLLWVLLAYGVVWLVLKSPVGAAANHVAVGPAAIAEALTVSFVVAWLLARLLSTRMRERAWRLAEQKRARQ